jgi:hypothetical protein
MWEPRPLATVGASTACNRDIFTFLIVNNIYIKILSMYYEPCTVVTEHVDLMPSEDGQLTETCKGNKYLQVESHWTVLTIIIL